MLVPGGGGLGVYLLIGDGLPLSCTQMSLSSAQTHTHYQPQSMAGAGLALETQLLSSTLHFFSATMPQVRNQPTNPPSLPTQLSIILQIYCTSPLSPHLPSCPLSPHLSPLPTPPTKCSPLISPGVWQRSRTLRPRYRSHWGPAMSGQSQKMLQIVL